jgi:hypothetical protein
MSSPESLIDQIRATGFSPTAPAASETKWRGFPVRWSATILFILAWNGLLFLDRSVPRSGANQPGLFALLALLLAVLVSWGIKKSHKIQQMILSDGHSVSEIKSFLSLVQIVAGFLLVIFVMIVLAHAFRT